VDAWLRGALRATARETLLDPTARERGIFDPEAVASVLASHQAGVDLGTVIWPMLCLEQWFRTCVDAAPATAAEVPVAA
jgi:asparagine synthase (glutamine-hydrolysing)